MRTTIEWNETILVPMFLGEVLCAVDDEQGRRIVGAYYDADRDAFLVAKGSRVSIEGVQFWAEMPNYPSRSL